MKKQITFLVACLLLTFTLQANANQIKYKSVDDFVKTLGSNTQVNMQADGDLNKDELADWAGIMLREKGEFKRTNQLYILLKTNDNAFILAEKSLESEIAGTGSVYIDGLEIKRNSLFISVNSKDGGYRERETSQIKLYNQSWRLIGLNTFSFYMDSDKSTETDINLLTGDVITTKKKGEKKQFVKKLKSRKLAKYLKDYNLYYNSDIYRFLSKVKLIVSKS